MEILKIKTGFAKKLIEKPEIITRMPAKSCPSDFSLKF